VLTAETTSSVARAYRKALTSSRRNVFFLKSSLAQLEILKLIGLRNEFVQIGIDTIKDEITRTIGEENPEITAKKSTSATKKEDGRAILFSGYMIDHPGKEKKNFPADKENEIRQEISKKLQELKINTNDRAFVSGLSAGSEIIFAEVCAEMGIKVKAFLPLPESAYIRQFVSLGGDDWVDRFYKIRNHSLVTEFYQVENVGAPKAGNDPYERNNRWTLYSALGHGVDKVILIALWNSYGDKPKDRDARLVLHMIELMRETGGAIEQISTSKYIHKMINNVLDSLMVDSATSETKRAYIKEPRLDKRKR
jgi:hypothetical protein